MSEEQVRELVAQLKDGDANSREEAAEALGNIGDVSAIPALIVALEDENDVGWKAVGALGKIARCNPEYAQKSVVPALIVALKDRSVLISEKAAWALVKFGKPAVSALIRALGDEDDTVRADAAWALGKIGDATATPALIVALKDTGFVVRKRAAEALGKIKDPIAISALIMALKDEEVEVRWGAIVALGKIGNPEAIEPLAKRLWEEKDRGPLQQIISSLVIIGDPGAIAHVLKYMDACPENMVRYLVNELGTVGSSDVRNMKLLHITVRKMKRKNYCGLSAEEKQDMFLKLKKTYLMWSGNLCEVAKQRVIIYKEHAIRNPKTNLDKPKPPVKRIHRVRRVSA